MQGLGTVPGEGGAWGCGEDGLVAGGGELTVCQYRGRQMHPRLADGLVEGPIRAGENLDLEGEAAGP